MVWWLELGYGQSEGIRYMYMQRWVYVYMQRWVYMYMQRWVYVYIDIYKCIFGMAIHVCVFR